MPLLNVFMIPTKMLHCHKNNGSISGTSIILDRHVLGQRGAVYSPQTSLGRDHLSRAPVALRGKIARRVLRASGEPISAHCWDRKIHSLLQGMDGSLAVWNRVSGGQEWPSFAAPSLATCTRNLTQTPSPSHERQLTVCSPWPGSTSALTVGTELSGAVGKAVRRAGHPSGLRVSAFPSIRGFTDTECWSPPKLLIL